ncbi:MAG: hypothetical protein LBI03_08265 [Clostridiales bacterium]|jgi:hypothetical protein|nr:hypothetical protein [Clostridiales bacterium]
MMCPASLVAEVTLIANIISEECSGNEIALLSAVFMQLADTLATIIVVQGQCDGSPGT